MTDNPKFGQELVRQRQEPPFRILGLSVADMNAIGTTLGQSGFFNDVTDQAKAFTKILAGQEIGVGPFEAMRGINVIQGRLSLSAGLVAMLVKRSGRYRYTVDESTADSCRLTWYERDIATWFRLGDSSFTMDDAQLAGLVKRGGGWEKYPQDMLFARALTRGARRYAADALGGSVYAEGEIEDGAAEEEAVLEVEAGPGINDPAPVADDIPAEGASLEPSTETLSDAISRQIKAFNDAEKKDFRDKYERVTGEKVTTVGQAVTTLISEGYTADMTVAEFVTAKLEERTTNGNR